jgi:GGDEF domain-containing protein
MVGRVGGDEFAVLLPGAGPVETAALADRLHAELAAGAPASLGKATFPVDGEDAAALHQVADLDLSPPSTAAPSDARPPGRGS